MPIASHSWYKALDGSAEYDDLADGAYQVLGVVG